MSETLPYCEWQLLVHPASYDVVGTWLMKVMYMIYFAFFPFSSSTKTLRLVRGSDRQGSTGEGMSVGPGQYGRRVCSYITWWCIRIIRNFRMTFTYQPVKVKQGFLANAHFLRMKVWKHGLITCSSTLAQFGGCFMSFMGQWIRQWGSSSLKMRQLNQVLEKSMTTSFPWKGSTRIHLVRSFYLQVRSNIGSVFFSWQEIWHSSKGSHETWNELSERYVVPTELDGQS